MNGAALRIVQAGATDAPLVLEMIRDLAIYEKLSHEVVATEADLREWLFGPHPAAEVLLAYAGEVPAGYALFFQTFSTFLGRPGLYLEDLFVRPEWRRQGIGRALLRSLAATAARRRFGRVEWAVLDWNTPSIQFYRQLGAQPLDGWTGFRLAGDALARLALEGDGGRRL